MPAHTSPATTIAGVFAIAARTGVLDHARTARLARAVIARDLPTHTIDVRAEPRGTGRYHALAAAWHDGPASPVVEEMLRPYIGQGFDGHVDGTYTVDHWLMPDGTTAVRRTGGTSEFYPLREFDAPSPEAVPVRFLTSAYAATRHVTALAAARTLAAVLRHLDGVDGVAGAHVTFTDNASLGWRLAPSEFAYFDHPDTGDRHELANIVFRIAASTSYPAFTLHPPFPAVRCPRTRRTYLADPKNHGPRHFLKRHVAQRQLDRTCQGFRAGAHVESYYKVWRVALDDPGPVYSRWLDDITAALHDAHTYLPDFGLASLAPYLDLPFPSDSAYTAA